jgi:hypothetical protein
MEKLVLRSTCTAAVLGRGDNFLLVYLDGKSIPEAEMLEANTQDFLFRGVVGLVNGRVEVECEPVLEAKLIVLRAAIAFAQNLTAPRVPNGDAVSWLENLIRLEDDRPE